MRTSTVVLEVVTADGLAAWDSPGGAGFDMLQATPPSIFTSRQPGKIPVTLKHGGPEIGAIDYLEEGLGFGNGGLYAVGVVDLPANLVDGQVYCSPEIRADALSLSIGAGKARRSIGSAFATSATLEGVALVDHTAGVCATKVRALAGDYRRQDGLFNWSGVPSIVKRAKEAAGWELRYRRPASIVIRRARARYDDTFEPRAIPKGELRYGPPGKVLSVR